MTTPHVRLTPVARLARSVPWIRSVLSCALVAAAGTAGAVAQQPRTDSLVREYARIVAAKGREPDAKRLHRLFDVNWRYRMIEFPEFATVAGYPGQNGRWTDLSLEAFERRARDARELLRAVQSIDRSRLSESDRLNYDLFRRETELDVEGLRFKDEYMPVTQLNGAQQDLPQVLAIMPATTVAQYEDLIARLRAAPTVIDQQLVLMRKGLDAGITPPRVTLRDVPQQIRNQIVDDPLASPLLHAFREFPAAIPEADRDRLRRAAVDAYTGAVRPAFERMLAFVADTYVPNARTTIGMRDLPDGEAWYAYRARSYTTTELTPDQIHQLGLDEVKRIRGEIDSIIASTGFEGGFDRFVEFLRTDSQFFFPDSATLIRSARELLKRVDPELIRLFGKLPRLPYGVVPVPSYSAKSQPAAYYQLGSTKAGRPGQFFINWYDLPSRPTWGLESLVLHEAVPGHHLQLALADDLENVPEFRRYSFVTAFIEGWALYAEGLGSELGLYRDPYSKFGQLANEIWRAIRLVLDTGIHAKGWTREQAIEFFLKNGANTEHDVTVEVDRYIVWPGQALAYKMGELKFKELRAYAARELGDRFDIRTFHDRVLAHGAIPLSVLDAEARRWVAVAKREVTRGERPDSRVDAR